MLLRVFEEANLLSMDSLEDLALDSPRFVILADVALRALPAAMAESVREIQGDSASMEALRVLHVLMLVATVLMCGAFVMTVLKPVQSNTRMEALRLSFTLAELPKDMRMDELIVALREEQARRREEDPMLAGGSSLDGLAVDGEGEGATGAGKGKGAE